MKHITPYKLFESVKVKEPLTEEIQYLNDIFQELTDGKFNIQCTDVNARNRYVEKEKILCKIIRYDINDGHIVQLGFFSYSEVMDYILSAISYMESIGFDVDKNSIIRTDGTGNCYTVYDNPNLFEGLGNSKSKRQNQRYKKTLENCYSIDLIFNISKQLG